ncbi:E3 SUMO-protein ligase RanBP2 [Dermatophagoides pteronyssinus]|uniref:E3 SUMO-protein ligase RanBP2 n=1 Tax=Dermatophagoides pteronyssinus TaxID=6956 RepID=A0ABQ8J2J1_DERPT|nr:E3 SUMO-protein ligase RanBP2 [Dermatophagoides pteronyssinus]
MFGTNKSDLNQKILRNLNIAKLFFQNKDYRSALMYINELLELKPDSSEAYKFLSQINEALGENELAIKNYQKSLELKSIESANNFLNDSGGGDQIFQSPSRLKTFSNRMNMSPRNKNGPNIGQNSPTTTTTVTLDSDIFKAIENLIETKFSTIINSIQMIKDQMANSNSLIAQNNAQAITMLKQQFDEMDKKLTTLLNKNNEMNKSLISNQNSNKILMELQKDKQTFKIELDKISNIIHEFGNMWTCEICAVTNDDNVLNCVSCESPRNPAEQNVVKNLFASPIGAQQQQQQQTSSSLFGQTNSTFKFGSFNFPAFSQNSSNNNNNDNTNVTNLNTNQTNSSGLFGFKTPTTIALSTKTEILNNPQISVNTTKSLFSFASSSSDSSKTSITTITTTTATTIPSIQSNFSFNASSLNVPNPNANVVSNSFSFPNITSTNANTIANVDIDKSSLTTTTTPFSSTFQFGNISTNQFPAFNNLGNQLMVTQSSLLTSTPEKAQNSGLFSFSNNMNLGQNTMFSPPKLDQSNNIQQQQQQHESENEHEHDQSGSGEDLILPKVNLPENYEHITGEEDELEIYCMKRAKLYVFVAPEYKERGTGELKILRHKITKKLRMVMRRDQVHTVCLNTWLNKDIKFDEKSKHVLFQCIDFSDNKPDPQTFALKSRDLKEFLQFIKENLTDKVDDETEKSISSQTNATVSEEISSTDVPTTVIEKSSNNSLDEDIQIVFVREPKPEHLPLIDSLKLPKNFFSYEEKQPCKGCIGCRVDELSWNDLTHSTLLAVKDEEQQQQQNSNPWAATNGLGLFSGLTSDVQTAKIDTIKLNKDGEAESEVETFSYVSEKSKMLPENYVHITGEENEEVIYKERAKLYRYIKETNEFKERGVGEMKILRKRDTDNYRLLMRRDNVFKIICNHQITEHLRLKERTINSFIWGCKDFSENPNGEDQIFVIKFKDETRRNAFQQAVEKCMPSK